jgi:hypothetical protein
VSAPALSTHLRYACFMMSCVFALLVVTLSCSKRQPEMMHVEVDGRTYDYRPVDHPITDLDKDILNLRRVETEHLIVQYNVKYEANLGDLIAASEQSYERVASDLMFDRCKCRPTLSFLDRGSYGEVAPVFSPRGGHPAGFASGRGGTSNQYAVINTSLSKPGTDAMFAIVAHELTHIVFGCLDSVPITPYNIESFRPDRSLGMFDEAVAQEEGLPQDSLGHRLASSFPSDSFYTVQTMDTLSSLSARMSAILELRVLVRLLERRSPSLLPEVIKNLSGKNLPDAISSCAGIPYPMIEGEWFSKMKRMTREARQATSQ